MNPNSVTEREHDDKFADRYVLGEGYPHKYYDAVGVRSSRDFAGPLDLKWPKEFRGEDLPKNVN